jgi:hypothetical protein
MDTDNDANKALYGKEMSAKDIVKMPHAPDAAKPLVSLLDEKSPAQMAAH